MIKEEKQVAATIVEQSNEINCNLIEIKKHIQMKIKLAWIFIFTIKRDKKRFLTESLFYIEQMLAMKHH